MISAAKGTSSPSPAPLDNLLAESTEDDLAQVTREDCRRYLKEKGMRRPSWNKSQAIQQVLSLKSILESQLTAEDVVCRKSPSKPPPFVQTVGRRRSCSSGEDPVSASDGSTSGGEEKSNSLPSSNLPFTLPSFCLRNEGDAGCLASAGVGEIFRETQPGKLLRVPDSAGGSQLTVFYAGKVNVFDNVPQDKVQISLLAREILRMGGSGDSPQIILPRIPTHGLPGYRIKHGTLTPSATSSPLTSTSTIASSQSGGPKTRKESVQRFLEKRKDRCRMKPSNRRPKPLALMPSMELYLNQQIRESTGAELMLIGSSAPNAGDISSLEPFPAPTQTVTDMRHPVFSVDLNFDDNQDAY